MASKTRETSGPVARPDEGVVEQLGIERIVPEARTHGRISDNFTLWFSANLVISTVALGALAVPVFGLGWWDSIGAIILFNTLGSIPVAVLATMGPKLGLRQMTISRFSFGWVGAGIMAFFNVAACTGWSAVNAIVGGQLVAAVSGGTIARPVAILAIAVVTTVWGIFGYKHVHRYARYAWIPAALIFALLIIVTGPKVTIIPTPVLGIAEIASFVSFGGAIFGFATGWSSYAADYNVRQPERTPARRVFWLTFLGIAIPCMLLEIFGMALTTAFKTASGGDLLMAAAQPLGGVGSFLLILLALSIVANNVPNAYSIGLSMQVLSTTCQRVGRVTWTLFGAVLYLLIAIPAVSDFNNTLSDFLLIIAYWLGPWTIILIEEHSLFRRGGYNVEDWDNRAKLPIGWAALVAMGLGMLGIYLGAAQTLYVGPIANLFNPPYGMDIGFELGLISLASPTPSRGASNGPSVAADLIDADSLAEHVACERQRNVHVFSQTAGNNVHVNVQNVTFFLFLASRFLSQDNLYRRRLVISPPGIVCFGVGSTRIKECHSLRVAHLAARGSLSAYLGDLMIWARQLGTVLSERGCEFHEEDDDEEERRVVWQT